MGIAILMYHKVSNINNDYNNINVSMKNFREQMMYLKKHYKIKTFEDNNNSENSIIITFDDGFDDMYYNAFPILKELSIPATVFVSTDEMESDRELWQNDLIRLLLTGTDYPEKLCVKTKLLTYNLKTQNIYERIEAYRVIRYILLHLEKKERDEQIEKIIKWSGMKKSGRKEYQTLTGKMCKELSDSGLITIGAHTMSHPSLSKLSSEEQEKEIFTSKKILEEIINKEVNLFAYPFGNKPDYDKRTMQLLKEMKFKKAVTTISGITNMSCNNFELPRVAVGNWNKETFAKKIEAVFNMGEFQIEIKQDGIIKYIGYILEDNVLIESNEQFIIFGTGKKAIYVYDNLRKIGQTSKLLAFCDNNKSKHGMKIDAFEIISPEKLAEQYKHIPVVIASTFDKEILEQLDGLGIKNIHIIM